MADAATPNDHVLRPHRRIVELDALRALAAISLMLFHLTHVYSVKYGFTTPLGFEWPYGAYGTEMFFILSGFVNSMSLLRRGRPVDFVAARLIRIVPMFLIVILANIWILSLAPLNEHPLTTSQLAANLTLLPMIFGQDFVDPVMWTLQVEMLFYFTLVALYRCGGLKRYFVGWGTLLLLSYLACPMLDAAKETADGTAWFSLASSLRHLLLLDYVPLFTMGFLLYMIKTGTGPLWKNLSGIGVAAFVFHSIDHGKHNPVATLLILGLITACAYGRVPVLRLKPLLFISTISYALYLCHNNLGCALIHRLDHSGYPPVVCFALSIVFAISLATLVTTRIEGPMTEWLRSKWERYRSDQMKEQPQVAVQ
ncbi:acyltransferase family protein [Rhodopirellula sp. MGV]|uniref:acyltransferase family protein n=1 Tax=Rhodopirellula sp. MGV TaxID=2023130 RepID=UPI000B97B8E9|nr:acyltransferase [Rhodopirellula sp. MGV]OYP36748.1 acyltransferase [Rhodopirellula sp. MGV]PNY34441.1 acyltransferase [Rhodopirellula baltica]